MKIDYITSNEGKFKEASIILKDWDLERIHLDLVEIQGTSEEIILAKAQQALSILGKPLIVEDVSLFCPALNGLPGPYVKDFLVHLGEQGLSELIHKYEDHSVKVVCLAAFIKPGREPLIFEGTIYGKIVAPRGTTRHSQHSWNTIVQPNGLLKTFGEMTFEEHGQHSMRGIALRKLKQALETSNLHS